MRVYRHSYRLVIFVQPIAPSAGEEEVANFRGILKYTIFNEHPVFGQKVYGELCTCNFSSNNHNLFLVLCTNEAVWIVVAPLLRVRVAVRFQAPIVLALVALHFQRSPGGAIYSVFTYFHLELIEPSAREVLILWTLVEKEEQGWGGGRRGPRLSLMRG